MVRLNKQTDFHFPFAVKDSPKVSSHKLDLGDTLLSSFAFTFFLAIIIAISMDESRLNDPFPKYSAIPSQSISKNDLMESIPSKIQKSTLIEFPKINSNHKTALKKESSNPISSKIPSKNNSKINSNQESQHQENKIVSITKKITNSKPIQNPINSKNAIYNSSAKTMVTPKLVFVDNQSTEKNIKINKKVTQDLLPLSYFHAKKKALDDNKFLILKFGAKWCLPCRQMEKTTFRNEEVKKELNKGYITLNIDVDDFDGFNLKSYFNVEVFPTLLIFDSKGNFVEKYTNYQSASSMLDILRKYQPTKINEPKPNESDLIANTKSSYQKIESQPSINFHEIILSKKRNGNAIQSLKAKAKNWRYTSLTFSTQNIIEGELLLKVKEATSGFDLTKLKIPLIKNQGIADTTTTNFQLVLEHEKRKRKNGEYVVEIYHISHNDSMLVGTTTLLKGGEILF